MSVAPAVPAHRARTIAGLGLAAALALGACAGAGHESTSARSVAPGDAGGGTLDAEMPDAAATEVAPDDGSTRGTVGGVDLTAVAAGRQIVSTAFVDLTAEDADAAARAVSESVTAAGGFVSGEDTSRLGGTRTVLVVRVPPDQFTALLDGLADLGELTGQRIETDEVTEQVVDLRSRITTAEASVVRLRELLGRTGDVAEIAQVERELLSRETTLETLRGQLRTIERQVELATVTVTIDAEDPAPVVADGEDRPSFLAGFASGWDALLLTLSAGAAVIGALSPWAVLVALVGVPLRWVWRSRRSVTPSSAPA